MKKFIIFICAAFIYLIFVCPVGAVYIFDQGFESLQPPWSGDGVYYPKAYPPNNASVRFPETSTGVTAPDTQRYRVTLAQEAGRDYSKGDASLGGSGVSDVRDMQPIKSPQDSASLGGGTVGDRINRQTTPVSPTVGDTINQQPNVPLKVARPAPEIITVTPEQEKKIEDTGVVAPE